MAHSQIAPVALISSADGRLWIGLISLGLTQPRGKVAPRDSLIVVKRQNDKNQGARKSYTYFYSSKLVAWYYYLATTLGVELELPLAQLKIVTHCSIAVQIKDFITYFK